MLPAGFLQTLNLFKNKTDNPSPPRQTHYLRNAIKQSSIKQDMPIFKKKKKLMVKSNEFKEIYSQ